MPTEIGNHQESSKVGVYYVAPVEGWSNLATSYWSGYYQTRNPWAMEAYEARLAALDPAARAAALQGIVKEAGGIADSIRQGEADRIAYKTSLDDHAYDAWETMANNESREAIARGDNYTEMSKAKLDAQIKREQSAQLPDKAVAATTGLRANLRTALRTLKEAADRSDVAGYTSAATAVQALYLDTLRAAAREGGASGPAVAALAGQLESELQSVTVAYTNPDGSPMLDKSGNQIVAPALDGQFLAQTKSLAGQEGLPTQWSYGDMDRFKSGATSSKVAPFGGAPTGGSVSMSTGTSSSGPGAGGATDEAGRRAMTLAERAYDDTNKNFDNPYKDAYAGAGNYDPIGKYIPRTRATPTEMAARTTKLIADRGQEVKASARVDQQPASEQRAARQEARKTERSDVMGGRLGKTVLEAAGLLEDEVQTTAGGSGGASYEGT